MLKMALICVVATSFMCSIASADDDFVVAPLGSCDEAGFEANMRWCLFDQSPSDEQLNARNVIKAGVIDGSPPIVMMGFIQCQRHNQKVVDGGNACFHADWNSPVRVARKVLGISLIKRIIEKQ